jgi:cysteine desulfurase
MIKKISQLMLRNTSMMTYSPIQLFSVKPVHYFDYQATTPVDYRVLDAMMPYYTDFYGNPHSKTHKFGWDSAEAIERARSQVSDLIGADPK